MNFCSIDYLLFFLIVFLIYWIINRVYQNYTLLFASWFFYAYWDWRFLSLIVISTAIDFICGKNIYRSKTIYEKRKWLIYSLLTNLGILGYFKYANFFIDSVIDISGFLGIHLSEVTLKITLPIGISFYTFQSLSYTFDIYRNKLQPTISFLNFATFVAFFPQLVAGPIVRAKEFLFQLEVKRRFKGSDLDEGSFRFLIGFFKKAFIADTIAINLVDPVYANPSLFSATSLLIAIIGFTIQVYCDFSGYSDMAIGSARMLGFRLPENFKYPYLSTNFSSFWSRWHLTMGSFFRDYLYIPLGGSKCKIHRMIINMSITWFLIGLWHGASWIYVTWGLFHCVFILINRWVSAQKIKYSFYLPDNLRYFYVFFSWFITQTILCLISGFFRLNDIDSGLNFIYGIFIGRSGSLDIEINILIIIAIIAFFLEHLYGFFLENTIRNNFYLPYNLKAIFCTIMVVFLYHSIPDTEVPFIYFQF